MSAAHIGAEGYRDAIILGFSINLDLFAASLAFEVVDRHGNQYYPTVGIYRFVHRSGRRGTFDPAVNAL
jgi:hypothetical protein